ncbi:MAG: PEP-utilizing enzyme [Patescibacteria group bacterium]
MKNLFKSKTSYEIIEFLVNNQAKKFYLNELALALGKNNANVSRELDDLISENIVLVEKKGAKKYYHFNAAFPAAQELVGLIIKNQNNPNIEKTFKRGWLLAEEIINANPWFMSIPFYCFTNQFAEPGGRAYQHQACVYQGYHLWFYFDRQDAYEIGEHLVDKFVAKIDFMEEVNSQIRSFADRLNELVAKIPEEGLGKLSKEKLWQHYQAHEDLHFAYYQWGWIPVAADMFGDNLTNRGKEILRAQKVPAEKIEEYLTLLTQPEKPSLLKEEQDNLIKIGIKVQSDSGQFNLFKELFRKFKEEDVKFFGLYTHSEEYENKFEEVVRSLKKQIKPEIMEELQKHFSKYFYTKFIYTEEQGVYNFEHYLKELVRLVSSDHNLAEAYRNQEAEIQTLKNERQELIKKLNLSSDLIRFFNAWGDFMVTKIYRRYAQLFALYKTTFILEEMAKRIGITLKELRFMTSKEIKQALFKGQINKAEVKSRKEFSLYYTAKDTEIYYSGEAARSIVAKYIQKNTNKNITELNGQCGCRGHARGKVKIINVVSDMVKMETGDILVSISTQPDLLPAMKKAAAFITDQGGVTSHAAIVAREMKTPCVIATKIATQVLQDGDEVEVDADKGTVKIITGK